MGYTALFRKHAMSGKALKCHVDPESLPSKSRKRLGIDHVQTEQTVKVERFRHFFLGNLFNVIDKWKARRMPLVCPSCFERASEATFTQGHWLVGEKKLHCDACGTANYIAGWRLAADYHKRAERFPLVSGN